jgi:hypothetical protein
MKKLVTICVFSVFLTNSAVVCRADSWWQYAKNVAWIRFLTATFDLTLAQEDAYLRIASSNYLHQAKNHGDTVVGTATKNGNYPIEWSTLGATETLGFIWLNSATGLQTTGPEIASVFYEVNLDPTYTNALGDLIFTALGTSTDAEHNFAYDWVISGFEPEIQATPMDSLGNVITIPGVDGYNVAIGLAVNLYEVPEPSTIALIGAGLVVLVRFRRKK